jgi:SAM dependent carboxyl methyltransferase
MDLEVRAWRQINQGRLCMNMEPMLDSYAVNSRLQASCQQVGNPMLARMATIYAEDGALNDSELVRIAEYGCAGGQNSVQPMLAILAELERGRPGLNAECVLEDLPSNPWHLVMREASKLNASPCSARALCAGTSFYAQVCGAASIDLAYSYVASHFLDDVLPLTTHVLMHEASPDERRAWTALAARDWKNFLLLRARELKKGGKMMISTMSRDGSGYSWQQFADVVWDCIRHAWDRGALTRQEAESLCIPACLRNEDEILAPFADGSDVASCFVVNSLQFRRTEVESEKQLPDAELAPIVRRRVESVWGGMFLHELNRLGRSQPSARAVMTEVWDRFEAAISQDASRGWLDMRCFFLQVTRT